MSVPGQINFTTTPYNQSNFYLPSGDRSTYGADAASSFNRQLLDNFWNKGLSMLNTADLDAPGVYTTTQVDTFDFSRYLGVLSDFFAKNSGYLMEAVDKAKSGNVFNLGALTPVAPKLEYIAPDNGDQNRWYGVLMNDVENQSAYRFRITQVTIDRYNADNNTNVSAIPASATRIYLGPDPLNSNSNTNYLAPMLSGCYSCRPNSCGKGYRMLYLSKNVNTLLDPSASFPQTTIPGQVFDEVIIVTNVEDAGDGGAYFDIIRNANRRTTDGTANSSGLVFRDTAISLAPGDFAFVGTFSPSTECIEAPKECQTYQPKYYKYCSTIREYVDCLGCVSKTRFRTYQFPRDIMNPFEQLSYQVIKNYRNYWHRVNNDIILGTPNYAQGYPFPPANPGLGASTNGEIIPFNVTGILPAFDAFARKLQITLTGCDQVCQLQSLETLISSLDRGSNVGLDSVYNDAGWLLVGDVEFLNRYYANQMTSYVPMTAQDRQEQINLMRQTYSNAPVSLIKAQNQSTTVLSQEFDKALDQFGIHLSALQIGRYTFKALHDRTMAIKEPGVVRLMHIPSISFFTDAQDQYMAQIFGGKSPFLPSSGITGKMIPSVVSYDMISTYLDGNIQFNANKDCAVSFFAYMRAGVRIKPKMFPFMLKIQFNSATANPSYNPMDPTSSPYIYGDVYNLNCGCMQTLRKIELNLDQWLSPTYSLPL